MDLRTLIEKYLAENKMMQIATVNGDQPWICTVYYVKDEDLNLYWISTPERRHSVDISKQPRVAAAIPVKFVAGKDVVGLQVEGDAQKVENDEEVENAMRLYTDKYDRGEEWYTNFIAGKNDHKLYRIKPRQIVVFDEENFEEARQVYEL